MNTLGYSREVSAVESQTGAQDEVDTGTGENEVEEPVATTPEETVEQAGVSENQTVQKDTEDKAVQEQNTAKTNNTKQNNIETNNIKTDETKNNEDTKENQQKDSEKKTKKVSKESSEKREKTLKPESLHPVWVQAEDIPEINAATAILIDPESGTIFYEKGMKEKMYPASMTKIVTALVVLDYFKADELVTVGKEINEVSLDSSKAGHKLGETLTVQNLLRGIIIPSGNDSANILATAVARRVEDNENLSFSKCEAIFTDLMNKKAEELGAINTHFSNAHGYHDEDHYSCAYDMALFSTAFMDNEILAEIASEEGFSGDGADGQLSDNPDAVTQDYVWTSHNLLVTDNAYQYPHAIGIKTGFTDEAGHCVAAAAEKDGRKLIAVVFNSPDPGRWEDAAKLFEYGFNEYAPKELTKADAVVKEVPLTKHNKLQGDKVPLVFRKSLKAYLPVNMKEEVKSKLELKDEYKVTAKDGTVQIKAPLKKGEEVGQVIYFIGDKVVAKEAVFAGKDIAKGTILNNIQYFFKNIFSLKGILTVVGVVVVLVILYLIIRILRRRKNRHHRGYTMHTSSRRKNKIHFK